MGRLKFTLANLWLLAANLMVSLFVENIAIFTDNLDAGFNFTTFVVICSASLVTLFMYFFLEHKRNGVKFDWILLPALIIIYAIMLIAIWKADTEVFTYANGSGENVVEFTNYEKLKYSIILGVVLIFTYATTFTMFANRPSNRTLIWMIHATIAIGLVSVIYSFFSDHKAYEAIFLDSKDYIQILSFYTNKNFYGAAILLAILACFIANYHQPRLIFYLLIVFFLFAVIASTCVLSAVISAVAVPIFLIVDVVHSAVKKKIFATIDGVVAIFLLLALLSIFFIGAQYHWKGFVGIDNLISKVYFSKDYSTLTGRTKIWEQLSAYIFDTPFHAIFGHGYMTSDKYIMAITSAALNTPFDGVKSAHNGMFQILFQGGLLGFIFYIGLLCYFIYCCIRLLMQKKYYFVFIYFFCFVCLNAHNFCEVSLFFDAGIKETMMTILFFMPVVHAHKMLDLHPQKIEEISELRIETKPTNYRVISRTISLVLIGLLISLGILLANPYTYSNGVLRSVMINTVGVLFIFTLFVPYLITLWIRKGNKLDKILRISINTLAFALFTFLTIMLFNLNDSMKSIQKIGIPAAITMFLFLETFIYGFVSKGNIKEYFSFLFDGAINTPKFALVATLLIGFILPLILTNLGQMDLLLYFLMMFINTFVYYIALTFLSFNKGKESGELLNNLGLKYYHYSAAKGDL